MEIHFILNTFYGFLIYFLLYVFTSKLINFPFKEAGFYDPAKLYPVYARSPLANVFPADLKVLLIKDNNNLIYKFMYLYFTYILSPIYFLGFSLLFLFFTFFSLNLTNLSIQLFICDFFMVE